MDLKTLVVVLLTWISSQIGCETPAPPQVALVAQQQLVQMAYGPRPPAEASVTALYDPRTQTVYLSDTWRADNLENRATLLHELVHHVQKTAHLVYPCISAGERLAYHLQAQWLKESGVADPYAFMQVDEFTISVLSLCIVPE